MEIRESLLEDLPDAEAARRFFRQFAERHQFQTKKLLKNEGLLSDVLTVASFSPLLAATVLQNPEYVSWLNRHRGNSIVRNKEELLESLARFALVNSETEPHVLLARFRRRELLRIFLGDVRRLATVSEITEELSNLADAVLEYALRIARQQIDNRYGVALEVDEKGRVKSSDFCIVSLGKLGSKELNYSSDIDLLFLYSADGATSGQGTRGAAVTNREYFVKLAESVTKLVGAQTGEGAAYRVDLRLRPHGRVGALALSVKDTIRYYRTEAQTWERQVLIRSHASAGNAKLYKKFYAAVENSVFAADETVENALAGVRRSKEKINLENAGKKSFNVKLGAGGIREIEFIAQALQLAHAGRDRWLRAAHTLKSLARLADRRLLSENDLTELFDAYDFLRRVEHLLQMENGLQTHAVPDDAEKLSLLARKMRLKTAKSFDKKLRFHAANVSRIFSGLFGTGSSANVSSPPTARTVRDDKPANIISAEHLISKTEEIEPKQELRADAIENLPAQLALSIEKSKLKLNRKKLESLRILAKVSPFFTEMLAAAPSLINFLPRAEDSFNAPDYHAELLQAVESETDYAGQLAILRRVWSRFLLEIAAFDVFGKLTRSQTKRAQTSLAEAAVEAALRLAKKELSRRSAREINEFPFAVLGLGKLGGRGMDYGSDLDLLLIYDDEKKLPVENLSHAEFYSRAVEIFVAALSSLTREGHLYRVDLRLRPDGKNGAPSLSRTAFLTYLETRAAIWEWLAYVKIRGAAGDWRLARETESAARKIIHENALKLQSSETGRRNLQTETRRIREMLERQKTEQGKTGEIDIKFGAGGMLDVYFAMRFLQLRDNIPDEAEKRSTLFMLEKLFEKNALRREDYLNFADGYEFLSELDHNLRLTVGRSTRLPHGNKPALRIIAERMKLQSTNDLLEKLTIHRINIRQSFESIMS